MNHNLENHIEHIVPLSKAESFNAAKAEWKLIGIEIVEEFDKCPCGQDIKELCYIENQVNQNQTYVGNICINRFLEIQTGNLFVGLKRIAKDDTANANADLIIHAYKLGYIFEKEYGFLMDTRNKRKLSEKQLAWKQKINRRIIEQTVVRRRTKMV